MGLYEIHCRNCDRIFLWFSGNLDQRCPRCIAEHVKLEQTINGARPGPEQRGDLGSAQANTVVDPDVAPHAAPNQSRHRSFLLEICARCGASTSHPGPILGSEPCECDNETKGNPSSCR